LQGAIEGEDVRARITHVEALAEAAARNQKGLRVFLRDETPLPSIADRLRSKGEGEVSLVVMLGKTEGEVEIKLPGKFAVSAAIAGSLKAVEGVVAVEHL
jgi:DNA polymerase-3 subunit alpha